MFNYNHKRVIVAVVTLAAAVVFLALSVSITKDYNTCIENGNSVAMCTGRG